MTIPVLAQTDNVDRVSYADAGGAARAGATEALSPAGRPVLPERDGNLGVATAQTSGCAAHSARVSRCQAAAAYPAAARRRDVHRATRRAAPECARAPA